MTVLGKCVCVCDNVCEKELYAAKFSVTKLCLKKCCLCLCVCARVWAICESKLCVKELRVKELCVCVCG